METRDATFPLNTIAAALQQSGLGEAVLIGNMGAAVHGARVMTDDFDYLVPPFRDLALRIGKMRCRLPTQWALRYNGSICSRNRHADRFTGSCGRNRLLSIVTNKIHCT